MILRPEPHFYSEKHPTPEDVLLLIEVSDSTLTYDRNVKKPLYDAQLKIRFFQKIGFFLHRRSAKNPIFSKNRIFF
jgi:hypothetical protein